MDTSSYISPEAIVMDVVEDLALTADEAVIELMTKWANDAACELMITENYEDKVDLVKIKNFRAEKPKNCKVICEVAVKRGKMREGKKEAQKLGYQITQWKTDETMDGCELEINLLCKNCHQAKCGCHGTDIHIDIDRCFLDSHPEIEARHMLGYVGSGHFGKGTSVHHPKFKLIRPKNRKIWHGIKLLPECANIKVPEDCEDYFICKKDHIATSIENGWMLISYLMPCSDDDGNLIMSTENKDAVKAVEEFIIYKYYRREYGMKREASSKALSQEAEQKYEDMVSRYKHTEKTKNLDWLYCFLTNSLSDQIEKSYDEVLEGKRHMDMDITYYGKN